MAWLLACEHGSPISRAGFGVMNRAALEHEVFATNLYIHIYIYVYAHIVYNS